MHNKKYTTLKNIRYVMSNWFRWDYKGTVIAFVRVPVMVVIPAVTALIPKLMIDYIDNQKPFNSFIAMLAGMSILAAFLSWIEPVLEERTRATQQNIGMHYAVQAFEKLVNMDYANLESYDGRMRFERCRKFAFDGKNARGAYALWRFTGLCISLLGIFACSVLLSIVNPLLIIVILTMCALEYFSYRSINRIAIKTEDKMVKDELVFSYFFRLATEPQAGKDIRLTGAKEWLLFILTKSAKSYAEIQRWFTHQTTEITILQALCSLVRDGATYGFLVKAVLDGRTDVADFLFYFVLVTGFSGWINGISGHVTSLQRTAAECQKYREFLELPDRQISNCKEVLFSRIDKIEFCNVSFSYGKGESVLQNINFAISGGEKIAIVGENGAGKTTLIKLLCGLYRPIGGQIHVNGTDISEFSTEQYFDLFSAVFQENTFLPTSILSNISIDENIDEEKAIKCIKDAGLTEKLESLENGLKSKLVKQLNIQAVDLSGGEKQRLLLARALYKNAPILILDEPTAALDPIAEEKLYKQYKDLTQDKTSFFISHRLTSTQFCDRILFMQNGRITESGSHEDLLALNGGYRQMYDVQGHYYRQEATV